LVEPALTAAPYTLSLHDALPISAGAVAARLAGAGRRGRSTALRPGGRRARESRAGVLARGQGAGGAPRAAASARPVALPRADAEDRKSTRLNSSHVKISYAVFCL